MSLLTGLRSLLTLGERDPGPSSSGARRLGLPQAVGTSGRCAPRSSALLAQIRARQDNAIAAGLLDAENPPRPRGLNRLADRWVTDIVEFLRSKDGKSPSADVVDHFSSEVAPENVTMFRGILKQVAQLTRQGRERVWVLKPEFA